MNCDVKKLRCASLRSALQRRGALRPLGVYQRCCLELPERGSLTCSEEKLEELRANRNKSGYSRKQETQVRKSHKNQSKSELIRVTPGGGGGTAETRSWTCVRRNGVFEARA